MKKILFALVNVLMLFSSQTIGKAVSDKDNSVKEGTIYIQCSSDLYNLAKQWSSDYCQINPGLKINLTLTSANELSEAGTGLIFISDNYLKMVDNKSLSIILIGRDIIIPIMNLNNPFSEKINEQGISVNDLTNLLNNPQKMNWGSLIENAGNIPVNIYFLKNESFKLGVANFLENKDVNINGIEFEDSEDLVISIQNDPYAIGFCKMADIINSNNQDFVNNVKILPIDKNGNGKIDSFEKIYDNLNDFSRGIWIGKYPKSLINHIYSVSDGLPKNKSEIAFLKWVLSDGQQLLRQNGFVELVNSERLSTMEKLDENDRFIETSEDEYAILKVALYSIIILVLGGFFAYAIVGNKRKRNKIERIEFSNIQKVINKNTFTAPNGLYYDKTHTWVFMEKDGIVRVGIDDFLQHITGPFTRIKMINPGEYVKKNDHLLSLIQEGKQLNVYAPFSGKIIDINENLVTNPSRINYSPYTEGWVYLIEPTNWLREIQFLQMVENYREWIGKEFIRIKDFLSTTINGKSPEYGFVAYQDGGELHDNVLMNYGPDVWEDFQKQFIDTSVLR